MGMALLENSWVKVSADAQRVQPCTDLDVWQVQQKTFTKW